MTLFPRRFREPLTLSAGIGNRQVISGEIVNKLPLGDNNNMAVIEEEELVELSLSAQGQLAREVLLQDMELLKAHGASPVLNIIRCYERDDAFAFFPTDVYSFHVDRSPIPTDTFLCTYYGEPSDILPNEHALQKVLVPEIREELKKDILVRQKVLNHFSASIF